MKKLIIIIAASVFFLSGCSDNTISVYAPSTMEDALSAIETGYEEMSESNIEFIFGDSQEHVQELIDGKDVDILISSPNIDYSGLE